jgi:phage-related minor tail protein
MIGAGFAALTGPIGLAILAVAAVAAAGIQMYRHRDSIKIRMGEIRENIKDFTKVALDKIVEYGTIFGRVFL